jgi:hypothetical protein
MYGPQPRCAAGALCPRRARALTYSSTRAPPPPRYTLALRAQDPARDGANPLLRQASWEEVRAKEVEEEERARKAKTVVSTASAEAPGSAAAAAAAASAVTQKASWAMAE